MKFNLSISDYLTANHFLFLDAELKEYAEPLLEKFSDSIGSKPPTLTNLENALYTLINLNIPSQIKPKVPSLIREFFEYLDSNGELPESSIIFHDLEIATTSLLSRFRIDGSVKGSTHIKKYTETGRNELCPCGSNKKFKKCCGSLISD